jgi:hypothetical protein
MMGIEDRPMWLRPHDSEKDDGVEKRRSEHVFTTLKTASDRQQEYSTGLFYGAIAGIVAGALVTLVVIWCVTLVYLD